MILLTQRENRLLRLEIPDVGLTAVAAGCQNLEIIMPERNTEPEQCISTCIGNTKL